jgi:hypothetical protein
MLVDAYDNWSVTTRQRYEVDAHGGDSTGGGSIDIPEITAD